MAVEEEKSKGKRWYVVHARANYEEQVMETLKKRINEAPTDVRERFGDILVPMEEVVEIRMGKKQKSKRKFFPGYVLMHMEMDDEIWQFIRKASKHILGFLGGTDPAPLSQQEADNILQRVQEGVDKPRPKVLFEPGEVIRVKEGPFTDFNGVVEEVNYEKNRLKVAVLIFGRSTPVELEFSQVEKS
jgi:transcription termination/antitermination protein NusG